MGMNLYLLEIKKVVDQLATVGAPISTEEHIKAILNGLSTNYTPLVTLIISLFDPYSIKEVEAFLLAMVAQVEKCNAEEVQLVDPPV